ncbi:LytTR family DNA-binding domain-containing protein [Runella sp.]|uniref:LytR/AlgR family response regulator transcription factor n=1 Tax=Runella sp. TaxID=1960881 RepID=UPI00261BDE1B|nr:LytTR family DNA-binding domain-containing protein [Runella sp.]
MTHYINKIPYLNLVGACLGPLDALDKIYSEKIELVFLDIHMPELSGIDFMKLMKGRIRVILTTAYSQYALEGYELNVIDYLLKPIPFERFVNAVQKAKEALDPKETLEAKTPPKQEDEFMFVKTDSRIQKVRFGDIRYIESLGNYVSIYTEQERIVSHLTMKDIEERLSEQHFMRIHRSFVISLDYVQFIEGNQIFLDKRIALPLGETYRDKFFKALDDNMLTGKK